MNQQLHDTHILFALMCQMCFSLILQHFLRQWIGIVLNRHDMIVSNYIVFIFFVQYLGMEILNLCLQVLIYFWDTRHGLAALLLLRGYVAMRPCLPRHLFCTLKGNYVWRVHEVHTTIAPCLSTALTICLCEVKPSLAVFAGINRVRAGKQTAICQEQIKVAGGSAQRSAERRPVGDFRHPTPDHIYCLPSASCWKTFQQTWLVQAHVSSGGFTLVTMDDKFCFQDVLALECF